MADIPYQNLFRFKQMAFIDDILSARERELKRNAVIHHCYLYLIITPSLNINAVFEDHQ